MFLSRLFTALKYGDALSLTIRLQHTMPFHKGDKSGHFDASQNTFNLQDPGFGPSEGVYNNRMDPRYGNMNVSIFSQLRGLYVFE